jgi:hypothetical protein
MKRQSLLSKQLHLGLEQGNNPIVVITESTFAETVCLLATPAVCVP